MGLCTYVSDGDLVLFHSSANFILQPITTQIDIASLILQWPKVGQSDMSGKKLLPGGMQCCDSWTEGLLSQAPVLPAGFLQISLAFFIFLSPPFLHLSLGAGVGLGAEGNYFLLKGFWLVNPTGETPPHTPSATTCK